MSKFLTGVGIGLGGFIITILVLALVGCRI
jgi:hypothetical protein